MTRLTLSEYILLLSGLLILVSAFLLSLGSGLGPWFAAKVVYGVGVLLFVLDR